MQAYPRNTWAQTWRLQSAFMATRPRFQAAFPLQPSSASTDTRDRPRSPCPSQWNSVYGTCRAAYPAQEACCVDSSHGKVITGIILDPERPWVRPLVPLSK